MTPPEVILDISRLLSRVRFRAPTGVDRVEMAYAQHLRALIPERLAFAAVHPVAGYGRIPTPAASAFLDAAAATWSGESVRADGLAGELAAMRALWRARPGLAREPLASRGPGRAYLQVSPHHLDQQRMVRNILMRERARFVCLVHDLIPIEFPEYARPDGPARHLRRMTTVAELADGVMAVSEATRQSFEAHFQRRGGAARIRAVSLGVETPASLGESPPDSEAAPYFVLVGTIEPRKNHLLILNLWRALTADRGPMATPRLHLVGRRGWENENVIDMLDRCESLKGVVVEHGHMPDQQLWRLIRGARALLMPSFAEGFGLPVAEALQLGSPVLCSDIGAHREVAADVAEYLDPLDGLGWRQAVLDYAEPGSRRRASQIERMQRWRAPTWETHVRSALDLVDEVCR